MKKILDTFTIFVLLVLNVFMKNRFMTKSSDAICDDLFKAQTSSPYSSTGTHLLLINCTRRMAIANKTCVSGKKSRGLKICSIEAFYLHAKLIFDRPLHASNGYAHGTIAVNVTRLELERAFNACKMPRFIYPSIFNHF